MNSFVLNQYDVLQQQQWLMSGTGDNDEDGGWCFKHI